MTRFEYQSECKFPKLPQSKKYAERQKTSLSREQDDVKWQDMTFDFYKTQNFDGVEDEMIKVFAAQMITMTNNVS